MTRIAWIEDLDAQAACGAVRTTQERLLEAEADRLALAVHWADLHNGDALDARGRVLPGMEIAKRLGAPGTPRVREFAAAELAGLLDCSIVAASNLMADGLNLRHRHPLLWAAVHAHEVRVWQAQRIARDCAAAELSAEQARWIDRQTAGYVGSLPWGRFEKVLEAKIIEADPEAAEARRKAAEAEQFVSAGRCNSQGLKTLIAKAQAGDVVVFIAVVNRIAEALAAFGDTRSVGQRRAVAVGIIANPVRSLRLLADYQHLLATQRTSTSASDDDDVDGDAPDGASDDVDDDARDGVAAPEENSDTDDGAGEPALIGEGDLHPADNDADDPGPCPSCGGPGSTGGLDGLGGSAGVRGNPAAFVREGRALGLLEVDWRRLLPSVVFYCHLSQTNLTADAAGVARIEGLGAVTAEQLREFLRDTTSSAPGGAGGRCHVGRIDLKGVVDIAGQTPVDAYETPDPMREAMHLRHAGEVFPFSPYLGRKVDMDHTDPYVPPDEGGPPGQTHPNHLAPLRRLPHRLKTHGRWRIRSAGSGVYLWRTGYGHYYQVDATGSHRLTREAGQAWWDTLTRTATGADTSTSTGTPERTMHIVKGPRITLDLDNQTA